MFVGGKVMSMLHILEFPNTSRYFSSVRFICQEPDVKDRSLTWCSLEPLLRNPSVHSFVRRYALDSGNVMRD